IGTALRTRSVCLVVVTLLPFAARLGCLVEGDFVERVFTEGALVSGSLLTGGLITGLMSGAHCAIEPNIKPPVAIVNEKMSFQSPKERFFIRRQSAKSLLKPRSPILLP